MIINAKKRRECVIIQITIQEYLSESTESVTAKTAYQKTKFKRKGDIYKSTVPRDFPKRLFNVVEHVYYPFKLSVRTSMLEQLRFLASPLTSHGYYL